MYFGKELEKMYQIPGYHQQCFSNNELSFRNSLMALSFFFSCLVILHSKNFLTTFFEETYFGPIISNLNLNL